jgi:hypothetical protein
MYSWHSERDLFDAIVRVGRSGHPNRCELENIETRSAGHTDASLDSCSEPKEPLVVEAAI